MNEPRMLLVDDDATFLHLLARGMRQRGYACATAGSIAEALQCAQAHCPQLAVIDLKIDQESGLHLVDRLHQGWPALRMVVLTGYASVSTAVEAIKLGAVHYLCKPATLDEILTAFGLGSGNAAVSLRDQPTSVDRLEWEYLQKILHDNGGNISATARALDMHRRTLQRKLQRPPEID